ncbi:FkbM family methyltransferase, partial [Escherichia coli]|uniref:FkbM family methyltransferase n=1 Tax=Escherichia coli TaxID=562 RepID=UPI0013D38BDF
LVHQVPMMPLSGLFASIGAREIHWLKIDVEGMEKSVIESWSPSARRPWIVVVESTLPNSQIPSHAAWEST